MKIEFSNGAVLQSQTADQCVQLLLPKEVFGNLCQSLVYLALLEAKQGHTEFANDLLWIESELQKSIVSE